VQISIGSLAEPPILRLGPNVEAAVTSIRANNASIIVKLDNPDTRFHCDGTHSTQRCILQMPPGRPRPPLPTRDGVGTFSLFGSFRVPLGYSTSRDWIDTSIWVVASADEVTTLSVHGASSSGALLQCSTKYCEVQISIGSLAEPPILRLGPNVEAAVTDISANNAVIIVQLDNPDTQFHCGGSASTQQCIVQTTSSA